MGQDVHYYFMYNRLTFMEHYHMRSNIGSAYSTIKGKFGSSLRSKGDTEQITKFFVRCSATTCAC